MSESVLIKDIYKSILIRQGLDTVYEGNYTNPRKKFNFLRVEVLHRNKLDFGTERKTRIPKEEVPIVEELIYRSLSSDEQYELFVDWFNGNIMPTDYQKKIDLAMKVYNMLEELYQNNWDMCEQTKKEWLAAIESHLNVEEARTILLFERELRGFFICSDVLAHQIPFGEIVKSNKDEKRTTLFSKEHVIDFENKTIKEILAECNSQSQYLSFLEKIISEISQDAKMKSSEFIKAYAEIKKFLV